MTMVLCEGSGRLGRRVGLLLLCATCGATMGNWPAETAPQHERADLGGDP